VARLAARKKRVMKANIMKNGGFLSNANPKGSESVLIKSENDTASE